MSVAAEELVTLIFLALPDEYFFTRTKKKVVRVLYEAGKMHPVDSRMTTSVTWTGKQPWTLALVVPKTPWFQSQKTTNLGGLRLGGIPHAKPMSYSLSIWLGYRM